MFSLLKTDSLSLISSHSARGQKGPVKARFP